MNVRTKVTSLRFPERDKSVISPNLKAGPSEVSMCTLVGHLKVLLSLPAASLSDILQFRD